MAEPRYMQAPLADDAPTDNLGPRKPPLFMQAPEAQREDAGSFFDLATGVAGEFNQGLLDLLGAPVDLANLGLSQLNRIGIPLGSDRPVGGSRQLRDIATKFAPGLFPKPPDTLAGRTTSLHLSTTLRTASQVASITLALYLRHRVDRLQR